MPTQPTQPTSPNKPLDIVVIPGNYDITQADTEELKRNLDTFLKWLNLPAVKNNPSKKAEYEHNVEVIQAELSKRENNITKISPEVLKCVTTGVTNAAKEILNRKQ